MKYNDNDYCIPIVIDTKCKVNEKSCMEQETLEPSEICSFDDSIKPTTCIVRPKVCSEYGDENDCNNAQNCAYISYYVYGIYNKCSQTRTDSNCIVTSGDCKNKTVIGEYEKCDFNPIPEGDSNSYTFKCEKRNKVCSLYNSDSTKYKAYPRTNNYQCFMFSSTSYCQNITLDGNCYVNATGDCATISSGKLSTNEICDLNTDKSSCQKRNKECYDYEESSCGDYTPEAKLCYNIEGICQEVKVDSQCSMNANNECTGNSCQLDKENGRCYYKDNNSSLLKISQVILLILFFMF